ncbi:restriction endonuclease subunit S [Acinetobacter baumannii]|uniref:restriction endonuclease subunit S n=1 Tax=Acinetobacter baumannii TaxID=470 RepID=UPI0020CD6800|nr:restriction endonuclease subunit S [Acinetobacter baumannii]MCQ1097037.1 restriction endonuclease subunit S [Acinetobacter baumannii]MDA3484635.1 restriction endonuclease subunit S [Acinetobacter baumannii]MDA3540680.1 restriction endonuclease subunit S [Acinetobacter baumannii]MDA3548106.1 restriction endonuclease subunit S [Acinetobacter baumannii]
MSVNWSLKKISDICEFQNNKRVPLKSLDREKRQGEYPYYGASGIVDYIDNYIFDGKFLLISEDGENLRTRNTPIAFQAQGRFWVNNHAHILAEKEEGILDYLEYYFSILNINPYITGAVQPKLNKANLDAIEIPIPPVNERLLINQILNSLKEKILLNNQINQTLESIAQAIFKSWFIDFDPVRAKIAAKQEGNDPELAAMCAISGKSEVELEQTSEGDFAELQATAALFPDELVESELGEVPKGWEILDIDKTTSLIIDHRGKTPKKLGSDWSDTGITVLSAKHIKDGYIVNREQLRFVDTELYNKWMKEELEEGDILLTSEGPMGEMYYLASDEKYCLSQRLYALRANTDLISSAFLYFWLLSPYAKSDMNGRATGTTVVGIRQSELRKVKVLTPPKNICDLFNEKVKANLKQIALNNNKSVDLAHIRDILLPKLMAGDLTLSVGLLDE